MSRSAWLVLFMLVAPFASAGDWPQWRGPNRNGSAEASPKLADAWPKEGLKPVWKSAPIPSGQAGGLGSVVVADGKAFVCVNWKVPNDRRIFPADALNRFGWNADLPDELAQKLEAARLSEKRAKLQGEELNKYIKEFIAANLETPGAPPPGQQTLVQRFSGCVQSRLKQGPDALTWEALAKLGGLRDMEFTTAAECDKLMTELGLPQPARKQALDALVAVATFTDTVICLDAITGKEVWKREFPGRGCDWGCSATPTIVDGKCFVAASNARFYCLSAKDGALVWIAATKNGGRVASSALAAGNAVFVLGGELLAFNKENGRLLWCQPKVKATENSPVLWTSDGKNYLICNTQDKVFCVEPEKGDVLWQADGGGCATATISGDTLVVYCERGLLAYTLTPQAAQPLWAKKEWHDRGASALIYQDCVYIVGGRIGCLDLKTGGVKWEQKAGGEITSPILVDGKIISGIENCAWTVMFKAAPEKYEELGRAKLEQLTCSSPAVAGGRLYVRLNDGVGCFDLVTMPTPPVPPAAPPAK